MYTAGGYTAGGYTDLATASLVGRMAKCVVTAAGPRSKGIRLGYAINITIKNNHDCGKQMETAVGVLRNSPKRREKPHHPTVNYFEGPSSRARSRPGFKLQYSIFCRLVPSPALNQPNLLLFCSLAQGNPD